MCVFIISMSSCVPYSVVVYSKGVDINGNLILKAKDNKYIYDLHFTQDEWDTINVGEKIRIQRRTLELIN
jgi:hypothetical protein